MICICIYYILICIYIYNMYMYIVYIIYIYMYIIYIYDMYIYLRLPDYAFFCLFDKFCLLASPGDFTRPAAFLCVLMFGSNFERWTTFFRSPEC